MTKRLLAILALAALLACGTGRDISAVTASSVSCTSCHGDPSRASDPLTQAAPPASPDGGNGGAHLAHLERGVACGTCHVVPTAPTHANGAVDVTFSGNATAQGATPTFSGGRDGTCSNVYCHGATLNAGGKGGPPSWSGGRLACDACHGAPPPSHDPGSTSCASCHPGTVNLDGTIKAGGLHVNGQIDAGHPAGWADPTQHGYAAKRDLASCKACHGANLDGVGGTGPSCATCHAAAGYANWQSNCTFCHGTKVTTYAAASLPRAAPPKGTQGETLTSTRAVGAHQQHLAGGSLGPAVACGDCHAVPTNLAHLDGSATVTFGGGATRGGARPTFGASLTCASTYCHGATLTGGSNPAPSWTGGSSQTTCGSCHGVPPPAPHTASTSCGTCHTGYTATTVNATLHLNGAIDATSQHPAGWAAKDQHGYAANRQGLSACTSCHGTDFNGGTTGVSCDACHATAGFASWQTNCTFCHGTANKAYTTANLASAAPPVGSEGETATTARAVGAHQKHLTGGATGPAVACTTCHAVPTSLSHLDGVALVALTGPAAIGGAATWSGTTCATYCHGATLNAGGSLAAPSWTGGPSQAACGTCHGIPPPAPHTTSTSCGTCHTGYTATTVNATLHLNGAIDATSQHPAGWAAKDQHGYAANRQGLSSCKSCHGTNLDGAGATGPSCTACHATAGFASWATSCTFCHGNRTSGLASPPVDTQGGGATSNVSVGVHASHLGTTLMTAPTCAACHPDRTGSNVITDAPHVDGDGRAEIAFGALARTGGTAATYTRASATSASCASVYCHGGYTGGAKATMSWTSATQVTCTSCHGLPPSTGHHLNHSSRDCGDCHPGYTRTSVNQATHVNGTKQVGNRITSWNATTRQCVGCHGSDTW